MKWRSRSSGFTALIFAGGCAATYTPPAQADEAPTDIGRGFHAVGVSGGFAPFFSEDHLDNRRTFVVGSLWYALRPLRWLSVGVTANFQTTSIAPVLNVDGALPIGPTAELSLGLGAGPAWFRPHSDTVGVGRHVEARVRAMWTVYGPLDAGLQIDWFVEAFPLTYPPSEKQGVVVGLPVKLLARCRF